MGQLGKRDAKASLYRFAYVHEQFFKALAFRGATRYGGDLCPIAALVCAVDHDL